MNEYLVKLSVTWAKVHTIDRRDKMVLLHWSLQHHQSKPYHTFFLHQLIIGDAAKQYGEGPGLTTVYRRINIIGSKAQNNENIKVKKQ